MRNRKSLLSITIFALVLVLSVGYAVVSYVDLEIGGTASAVTEDIDVSFKSVTPTSGKVYGTVTDGSLSATISASDLTLNVPQTVTYVVQNKELDVDASVIQHSLNNSNPDYFSVTTNVESAKTCSKEGTLNVIVTVTLIKTPVLEEDNSTTINITLRATPLNN